ncbi:MAG: PHP domain-containing protein [Candidatus Helarchaeota archaeon]
MLKLDLHVHTTCSKHPFWGVDGMCPHPEVIKMALRNGLDGLAITDHDTPMGAKIVQRLVKDHGIDLVVIPGIEVSTKSGHVLALGVMEEIPPKRDVIETLERIRDLNGVAVCAHPFRRTSISHRKMEKDAWVRNLKNNRKLLTAIETMNGAASDEANRLANELSEMLHFPKTGGSDAHILSHIGTVQTRVETDRSVDSILEEIRKGRTIVTGNKFSFVDRPVKTYFFKLVQLLRRFVGHGFNHCVLEQPELLFNIYNLEIQWKKEKNFHQASKA